MAAAAGVEPATCSLGESRSIQLSYATARSFSPANGEKQSDGPEIAAARDRARERQPAEAVAKLRRIIIL